MDAQNTDSILRIRILLVVALEELGLVDIQNDLGWRIESAINECDEWLADYDASHHPKE